MMRRVVVTGLGLVTPLGCDVETAWANLIAGKSGASQITRFDTKDQKCHIACEVKPKDHPWGFDPDLRVDHKVQRQVDPFIIYGIDAAGQAIEDAGLTDMSEEERYRAGCSIGSGIGGLPGIESESLLLACARYGAELTGPTRRLSVFQERATVNELVMASGCIAVDADCIAEHRFQIPPIPASTP